MNRIKEPSTWAGIAGIAQGAKVFIPPQWSWLADVAALVAGGVAVKMREQAGG